MSRRAITFFTFGLAVAWIAIDQLTKFLAEAYLVEGVAIPLIGQWFQLELVYNPGAAFGLASDYTWILTVIAGIAAVTLVVLATRVTTLWWALTIGSLLGGAVSHFYDRLLRPPAFANGHIVDFLNYGGVFVGNIADIALVGAAIGAVILNFRGVEFSARSRRAQAPEHE
ncbi:MAG: signal peptidase II [Microbacteriaceae bacterium]